MKLDVLKNKSLIWSSIGVLVLVVGIFVALQLIPQEQDIRQEASVATGGTAEIVFEPSTLSVAVGESKKATVSVRTNDININGLVAIIVYSANNNSPAVMIENVTFKTPFNANPWNCSNSTETVAGQVRFEVLCPMGGASAAYKTGPSFVPVVEFDVKGVTANTQPVVLSFIAQETILTRVDLPGEQLNNPDILKTPTSLLSVTVTGAEKKITVATPTLNCSSNDFTATATVTEGTTKKPGIAVSFKYNNVSQVATTNDQGVATTTFTRAATAMPVTAETVDTSSGYPTGTATATPPTNCGSGSSKTFELTLSGLSCGAGDFTAKAKVQGTTNISNVDVVFTYNGETKTARTNSSGDAEVKFNRASTNMSVKVDAGGFDSASKTATLPTNCSTSGTTNTTGASCNQSCTASRDCRSGLSCVSGFCRAAQCSSDTSCGCADLDVAAANGTTQLPESGFDQTFALTILGLLFLIGGGQLWWSHKAAQPIVNEED